MRKILHFLKKLLCKKTKLSSNVIDGCRNESYSLYHLGREDFEKGICLECEIGNLVSNDELERRCKHAEATDPERYRLGRYKEIL